MRLEITEDCCATARQLIADGLDPAEVLEFYRGDILSLRGTARAFAKRMVQEDERNGPKFVKWRPRPAFWKAKEDIPCADRNDFKAPPLG